MLLLDEPLGALDLKLRRQLQVELKRIQPEVGITFVYVTHDQEEALTMSDRIAVMNAGHVEQLGTPEELYERPRPGSSPTSSARPTCCAATVDGDGAARASSTRRAGGRRPRRRRARHAVEISIRPESIRLAAGGRRPGAVPAGVEQAAYLGTSSPYLVRTGRAGPASVLAPKAGTRIPVGSDVAVAWDAADALVLGRAPREPHGGDPHDRPSPRRLVDRPRARARRYLAERRISRR